MTFVVAAIDPGFPWPDIETEVKYLGREFILRPETEANAPSIVLELIADERSQDGEQRILSLLSAMSWSEQASASVKFFTGGSLPFQVGKGPLRGIATSWRHFDFLPEPSSSKERLVLALYREAQSASLPQFKVLSFFKILNTVAASGSDQKRLIAKLIPAIHGNRALARLRVLQQLHKDIPEYLYLSCRCAVAHANTEPIANPDNREDVRRLSQDYPLIQALAEAAIEQDYPIQSRAAIYDEHRYELAGFTEILGEGIVTALTGQQGIAKGSLPCFPQFSLRIRDQVETTTLGPFAVVDQSADQGVLRLDLSTPGDLLGATIRCDFALQRFGFDPTHDVQWTDNGSTAATQYLLAQHRFVREWLLNGQVEVVDASSDKLVGRTDPYLPVNIDPISTIEIIDRTILDLEKEHSRRLTVVGEQNEYQ